MDTELMSPSRPPEGVLLSSATGRIVILLISLDFYRMRRSKSPLHPAKSIVAHRLSPALIWSSRLSRPDGV
jgi:hypothetical protein